MRLRVIQFTERLFICRRLVRALFQGSPDVVMTFFLERLVFRQERTAEPLQRLIEIPHLVGRRSGVELDLVRGVRVRMFLQSFLELLVSLRVVVVSISIESRDRKST